MSSKAKPPSKYPVFEKAYWDRPPSRMKGDAEPSPIYTAIGCASSSWERAEQALADLFVVLASAHHAAATYNAVRRAYGSIHGNAGRRVAVRAAAETYFSPYWENKAVRQPLIDVINAFEWASPRRDDIVHGIVWGNITVDRDPYGSFLMPPEYNTGRTFASIEEEGALGFLRAHYRYIGEDINKFASKFMELQRAVVEYTSSVAKNPPHGG
jgi:hypothetical protein